MVFTEKEECINGVYGRCKEQFCFSKGDFFFEMGA
jgi:hypothetical protein